MRLTVFASFLVAIASLILTPSVGQPVGVLLIENLVDPITARSAAMAGAVCSSPGDYDAAMYSPATLGFTEDINASLGYYWRSLSESRLWHCIQAGVVYPVSDMSSLAASLLYFRDTKMTATDPNGNLLGTVRPYTVVSSLSYGRALTANLSTGGTGRLIFDSFPAFDPFRLETVAAVAVDISLHYRLPVPTVNAAVSLTNWGPEIEYPEGYFLGTGVLPTAFRTGLSVAPRINNDTRVYLGVDFSRILTENQETSVRLGGEVEMLERIILRVGHLWDEREYMGGLTYGIGLGIPGLGSVNFASVSKTFEYGAVSKNHITLDLQIPFSKKSVTGKE